MLLCFLFSLTNYAQIINLNKNNYFKAKVYLTNGTVKEGYIKQFNENHVFSSGIGQAVKDFGPIESRFGLSNHTYKLRPTKKGHNERILLEDIKKVERQEYDPETDKMDRLKTYEKIQVLRVKKDGVTKEKVEFLAPVFYKSDKITIYSFLLEVEGGQIYPFFYFKPKGKDYAIKPMRFSFGELMSRNKMYRRYRRKLLYIANSCKKLKGKADQTIPLTRKEFKKRFRTDFKYLYRDLEKKYHKKIKSAKKQLSSERAKKAEKVLNDDYIQEASQYWYDKYYKDFVMAYSNQCK